MESDTGFVQNVHRSHQVVAQRTDQADALAFTAAQGVRGPVEGQVAETYRVDVVQTLAEFAQRPFGKRPVVVVEPRFQFPEPAGEFPDGHRHQFVDVPAAFARFARAADPDVERLFAQPASAAGAAGGFARIAGEHIPVLNLVALALHPFEEAVDTYDLFVFGSFPEQLFLLRGELAVGFVNREVVFICIQGDVILEPLHHLAPPAGDRVVVDAARRIGHHQRFVHADYLAEPAADRAGPDGVVVAEKMLAGLFEPDSVRLEEVGKVAETAGSHNPDFARSLLECGLDGVERAAQVVVVAHRPDAVHHQPKAGLREALVLLQHLLDSEGVAFGIGQPGETVLLEREQFLHLSILLPADVGQNQSVIFAGKGKEIICHAGGGIVAHFASGNRGIGPSDLGEEQPQVIVNLRAAGHRRPRVARGDFLRDGDGRRNTGNLFDRRLAHAPQELPGERGDALRITALPFREKRVEGQRTLAAARDPGHDHQFAARDIQVDVFQIVDPGSVNMDGFLFFHGCNSSFRANISSR